MIDAAIQAWILLTSAIAIWLLSGRSARWRRIGCIVGLLGEPAWFYSSWQAGQWGVFALAVWFTIAYVRGWGNARDGLT